MTCLILCYYSFSTALCLTVFFKTHILQYVKCTLFFIYEKSHLLIFQPVFLTFFLKTYRLVCRLYSFVCVYHNTPYALDLHDYKLSSRKFKSPEKISLSNRLFHVRAACKSHFVLFGFACVKSALRIAPLVLFGRIVSRSRCLQITLRALWLRLRKIRLTNRTSRALRADCYGGDVMTAAL